MWIVFCKVNEFASRKAAKVEIIQVFERIISSIIPDKDVNFKIDNQ